LIYQKVCGILKNYFNYNHGFLLEHAMMFMFSYPLTTLDASQASSIMRCIEPSEF